MKSVPPNVPVTSGQIGLVVPGTWIWVFVPT